MPLREMGKDNKGISWLVECDKQPYIKDTYCVIFYAYPKNIKRTEDNYCARSIVIEESKNIARMEIIEVNKEKRGCRVGSLLLNYIERYIEKDGIHSIYGYISKDKELYVDSYTSLEEYLIDLKKFYIRNAWTWHLFGVDELGIQKNTCFIGKVYKSIRYPLIQP